MNGQMIWLIVAIAAAAAVAIWFIWRQRRSDQLRRHFGSEYEHAVRQTGDVGKAEANLAARERRVEKLHIRTLSADDTARFTREWAIVQERFVDDPNGATTEADRLVGELMHARGYPVGDFDRRVEDISVDHPDVVMNYRAAHDIAQEHAQGRASTEDLRQAMVHYRALFRDLLGAPAPADTHPIREGQTTGGRR